MSQPENVSFAPRTFQHAIAWLWQAGLRFAGVIDAGCGDGLFAASFMELGPFRDSIVLNVEPQDDFGASLSLIQTVTGARWMQCALGDQDHGTIDMIRGAHPFWSSTCKSDDQYWSGMQHLQREVVRVPVRTIDSVVRETGLPGPYLLKFDVQGAELAALRGARETLADTDVVVIETAMDAFADVNALLTGAGFQLFDVTNLNGLQGGRLGWFYPVYLHGRRKHMLPSQAWSAEDEPAILAAQDVVRVQARLGLAQMTARMVMAGWRGKPPAEPSADRAPEPRHAASDHASAA